MPTGEATINSRRPPTLERSTDQTYPMSLTKQQLADGVADALSDRAELIEVEYSGETITYVSTFRSANELEQRKEVAVATTRKLTDMGVFTMQPAVKILGTRLSVRFSHAHDLCRRQYAKLPGFNLAKYTVNGKTGKLTGPWVVDHNPLMPQNTRKSKNNNKNNKRSRNNLRQPLEQIQDSHVVVDSINYDDFDWQEMMVAEMLGHFEKPKQTTTQPRIERIITDISFTLKPNDVESIAGKYLNSIGSALAATGNKTDRRTRTAYSMWNNFMAAIGVVAGTEIFASLERLQNDKPTSPCSLTWIHNVLSGAKTDKDIVVAKRVFDRAKQHTTRHGHKKWVVSALVNGNRIKCFQARKDTCQAFHAAAKGSQGKPATLQLTPNGHYFGITWD